MRSATDSKIAGVCGGLAEYLGVDSTIVRLFWAVLAVVPGALVGGIVAGILVNISETILNTTVLKAPWEEVMKSLGKPSVMTSSSMVIWILVAGYRAMMRRPDQRPEIIQRPK